MRGSIEPEICTKMLIDLSKKLREKFPATTRGYSMVKLSGGFSLQQKYKKRRKRKDEKIIKKTTSLKDIVHFLVQKSHNFEQKCHKTQCYWEERYAVMLQMPF